MTDTAEAPKVTLERGTLVTVHVEGQARPISGKVVKFKNATRSYLVRLRSLKKSVWISETYLLAQ